MNAYTDILNTLPPRVAALMLVQDMYREVFTPKTTLRTLLEMQAAIDKGDTCQPLYGIAISEVVHSALRGE